ncbi:MAG: PIG-L family deacetylase [candidate division KSB1 bacterium]|nr:PIG-L family deacetylase [candidate division KSB1 bacterium]
MPYDILAISAHPDDIEIAMGGTVARLTAEGHRFLIIDLCDGEPTRHGEPGVRKEQALRAAEALGADRVILDFQDRFIVDSIEARLQVARLIREHRPRWIFSTTECGVHPDHKAIRDITDAAVFYARLPKWEDIPGGQALDGTKPWEIDRLFFYYCRMEPSWDRFDFAMNVSEHYEKKREAIAAYASVFSGKQAAFLQRVESADRYYGSMVGVEFAEIFRCRSPMLIEDLQALGKARFG